MKKMLLISYYFYNPIKWLGNIFFNTITFLSNIIIKRDEKIILMGAWMGEKFADNPRYLFQYLHEKKDRKVIWISRNKNLVKELQQMGYISYYTFDYRSIFYHLKAGTHIVCTSRFNSREYHGDIIGELSLGAKKIDLWHGIPLKGIGRTSTMKEVVDYDSLVRKLSRRLQHNDYFKHLIHSAGGWDDYLLLATSERVKKVFEEAFMLPQNNIIVSSYPRNTTCTKLLENEKRVIGEIKSSKTILYLPTFRQQIGFYSHPLKNENIKRFLEENKIIWIEKKHTADKTGKFQGDFNFKHIFLESVFDINVILPYVEVLITDYSSVCFDFLFLGKPVQYYVPDFESYKSQERGFSLDFDEYTAGWISQTERQLLENLKQQLNYELSPEMMGKIRNVISQVYAKSTADIEDVVHKLEL